MSRLPRDDRRELRRLKRRLRPLRWRCLLGTRFMHDYSRGIGEDLKACHYCYSPNFYLDEGLRRRLARWRSAVAHAVEDGAIQATEEDD